MRSSGTLKEREKEREIISSNEIIDGEVVGWMGNNQA